MNRLFLAIVPSSTVRAQLADYVPKVQEKLDRQGMRWMRPEKWHIEIGFFGEAEPSDIITFLESINISDTQEFQIELGGISGLPDLKRPGILHLLVENPSELFFKLRQKIGSILSEESEEDEFLPHLALSRMKPASTKLGHKLRDFMHSGAKLEEASWSVEELILFNALPSGEYEQIHAFPLSRNK